MGCGENYHGHRHHGDKSRCNLREKVVKFAVGPGRKAGPRRSPVGEQPHEYWIEVEGNSKNPLRFN